MMFGEMWAAILWILGISSHRSCDKKFDEVERSMATLSEKIDGESRNFRRLVEGVVADHRSASSARAGSDAVANDERNRRLKELEGRLASLAAAQDSTRLHIDEILAWKKGTQLSLEEILGKTKEVIKAVHAAEEQSDEDAARFENLARRVTDLEQGFRDTLVRLAHPTVTTSYPPSSFVPRSPLADDPERKRALEAIKEQLASGTPGVIRATDHIKKIVKQHEEGARIDPAAGSMEGAKVFYAGQEIGTVVGGSTKIKPDGSVVADLKVNDNNDDVRPVRLLGVRGRTIEFSRGKDWARAIVSSNVSRHFESFLKSREDGPRPALSGFVSRRNVYTGDEFFTIEFDSENMMGFKISLTPEDYETIKSALSHLGVTV